MAKLLGVLAAAKAAHAVDYKLLASARLRSYPEAAEVAPPTLWAERTALFFVARRLG